VITKWTVNEFNYNVQYLADQAQVQKKYMEIMNRKPPKK